MSPETDPGTARATVNTAAGKSLPVEALLNDVASVLAAGGRALVEAPPGAGKSTLLPLFLAREASPERRLVLIQPRRLAAGSIARFLAQQTGGKLGQRVGLRTRHERYVSAETALEVVTEGIFLRTIQGDPTLSGIGWVLFDEFHERSWQADLGLAFALESQREWREISDPLRLVVMSATLPAGRLQTWLQAPLLRAAGRRFPVAFDYAPPGRADTCEHAARQIQRALQEGARKVLVFLPGWGAIQRTARALSGLDAELHLLHSSVAPERQHAALALSADGRQSVVLATNIAETSLTIEGVDVVIDSGLVRRSRYDASRGMDRLEEGWISQASAEQRAGRAGRLGPGRCVRLWDQERQRRLPLHDEPEVLRVDAAPLLVELAVWGGDGKLLLDEPETGRSDAGKALLTRLGALDDSGWVTAEGRIMAALGLHPRLARLVLAGVASGATETACLLAALLSEGDFLDQSSTARQGRGAPAAPWGCDIEARLQLLRSGMRSDSGTHGGRANVVIRLARQLVKRVGTLGRANEALRGAGLSAGAEPGELLMYAFPDRLARRRSGSAGRFLTMDGFEVVIDERDPLAQCEWLVAAEHDGRPQSARVRLGAAVRTSAIAVFVETRATIETSCFWDEARELISARQAHRLGAIVLGEQQRTPTEAETLALWREQIMAHGFDWLRWSDATEQWLERARWLGRRTSEAQWLAFAPDRLAATLDEWLLPWLSGCRHLDQLRGLDFLGLLRARVSFGDQQRLEREAPPIWRLPSGRTHPVRYDGPGARLAARLTEFYGLDEQPLLAGEPLLLELLSPAGRPLQITADLPGFWRGAYSEVRKEMKGRYPKHFWPERPWDAPATATTKRHMSSTEGR